MTDDNKLRGLKKHNKQLNQIISESLEEALMLLMQEKPFDSISITELCQKAGVSRMAFYGNYKSKDDIITKIVSTSNHEILNEIGSPFRAGVDETWYLNLFKILHRRADLLKIIFSAHFEYYYLSLVNDMVLRNHPVSEDAYRRIIWAGGMVNTVIHRVNNDQKESLEDIAKFCYHSLNPWISSNKKGLLL